MIIGTETYGNVRYPEEILTPTGVHWLDCDKTVQFYKNLIRVFNERNSIHINAMMNWRYTKQGHTYWKYAHDMSWGEFERSDAHVLLRSIYNKMNDMKEVQINWSEVM